MGDLYIKISRVPEAVEAYERAANLYAESGFPNNAIALCNKVLRNAPARTHIYLKLAMLMVERGFVAEAKQNLLEYADRMQKTGRTEEAFRALKEFADLSPDNEEIRLLLAEQLKGAARTAEAREQLSKLYHEAAASGDKRRLRATLQHIRAIDPDFDPSKAPKPKLKERKEKSSELVFLDINDEHRTRAAATVEEAPPAEEPATLEVGEPPALEIEPTALAGEDEAAPEVGAVEGLDLQREFEVDQSTPDEGPLDFAQTMLGEVGEETETGTPAAEPPALDAQLFETPILEEDQAEAIEFDVETTDAAAIEVPDLDLGGFDVSETETADAEAEGEWPPLEEVEVAAVAAAPDLPTLEAAVADDPDAPDRHVVLGEALLETGMRDRGLEELDIALRLYEAKDEWSRAGGMADEIIRLEPNSVRHHQKRVELAFRTGEKPRLTEAYLGLGDALLRTGVLERARLVYQRVLEHDPDSVAAREALANLDPAPGQPPPPAGPASVAAGGDYVNLGALILDEDEPDRDTRMRVQDEEPTGDEERDFQEMLAQFKRGIEANIEEEDWQAHYDLGVAFKEMGLLDESIAEFQKALRSPAGRLRTAEALGGCFYDKGQFSVASTVMRRAIETDPSGDEAKIGLLYWLGRCEEEMKRLADALAFYQRVFALDIRFQDVRERVKRLTGAGH